MGEGGERQHGALGGESARVGQGAESSGVPRQDIAKPGLGGIGAGAAELPAGARWISDDAAGPFEQHRTTALLGSRGAGLKRSSFGEIREEPLEFAAMGGQPGGTAPALQPRQGRPLGEAIEAIGIEHQQAREGLELLPDPVLVRVLADARAEHHRVEALQG